MQKLKNAIRLPLTTLKRIIWNIKKILYVLNGRKPWTRGYVEYRNDFIHKVINEECMFDFLIKGTLTEGFGKYLDERAVEYLWLMANVDNCEEKLLDAGSALNYSFIIKSRKLQNKDITIVTLAPEKNCFWKNRISYNYEDLRKLPYRDELFDSIVSISTLEHVGMDNSIYSTDNDYNEHRTKDYLVALIELKRVLKKNGKLYISVPYGLYMNFGWYQQFNKEMIAEVIDTFAPQKVKETYFCYEKGGWQITDKDHCSNFEGFDIHRTKYFNKKSKIGYDPDYAACSRAIAAIELCK